MIGLAQTETNRLNWRAGILLLGLSFYYVHALPQALVNNYSLIYLKQGAQVVIKTNSINNSGLIDNAGELTIELDLINNEIATGGGSNGIYNVQRNWINNGVFVADQSKVNLYGTDQLITGSSKTIFYDLELTGSGIKRQLINSETSHLLSLNDRELATDSFEMHVSNSDPASIIRSSGFVSSLAAGRLSRNTDTSSSYLFPTGSSLGTLRYRPAEIIPTTLANHTFGVRLANTDATLENFNRSQKDSAICEVNPFFYHRIYRTNGADSADINIYYDSSSDGDWQDVAHWQNVPQWEVVNAVASISPPFSSFGIIGWNEFTYSPFALTREGPSLLLTPTASTCEGSNDGSIISVISGGQVPYDYVWNTGDTTASLTATPGGTYSLTVTDGGGCSAEKSAIIEEPNPIASSVSITPVECEYDTTGAIKLVPRGGTAPYHAEWSNGDTTLSISEVEAGLYLVTVTDAKNCAYQNSYTIPILSTYSIEATATNTTCDGIAAGTLVANIIAGNTPPYTYSWSTGETEPFVNEVSNGTYILSVRDSLSCLKLDTVTVGISGLSIEAMIKSATCPGIPDGAIQANVTGGTVPYSFEWNNGSTSSSLDRIFAGTYFLTVTDVNDCSGEKTVLVPTDSSGTLDCDTVLIYDTFSPNGDGINDQWIVDGLANYQENHLQIFNRWGNMVFEAKPYDNTWEGRSNKNELLPSATYYYILKLNDTGGSATYSGHVTLIR